MNDNNAPGPPAAGAPREDVVTSILQETVVLSAMILICSLSVTPDLASCDQSNAVATLRVPEEFGSPTTCFMHGQAYLADTSIGRDLSADERVRVICSRIRATAAAQ